MPKKKFEFIRFVANYFLFRQFTIIEVFLVAVFLNTNIGLMAVYIKFKEKQSYKLLEACCLVFNLSYLHQVLRLESILGSNAGKTSQNFY